MRLMMSLLLLLALDKDEVVRHMTALKPRLQACYERHHERGFAVVQMTIAPTGKVTGAEIVHGDFAGTPTGACILDVIRTATMPAFDGPPAKIDYPVMLGL